MAAAHATLLISISSAISPLRTAEEMIEEISNLTPSLTERRRVECVIKNSLDDMERTVVTRTVLQKDPLHKVAKSCQMRVKDARRVLSNGLTTIDNVKGVPAFVRVVERAKELGYFKSKSE